MKDCVCGFTLAGFQQVTADHDTVLEVMTRIAAECKPGLVFIDERLMEERIMGRLQLLETQWGGVIISLPVPDKSGELTGIDFGKRFISRVLGYQMKLS